MMTRASVPGATLSLFAALLAGPAALAQDSSLLRSRSICLRPAGCASGLWSPASCRCECIPPICRSTSGSCDNDVGQCETTNPWEDCTLGVDCPWWDNHSKKAESCTTHRRVPPGVWDIHATEADCCAAHHPDSVHCGARPPPAPPPPTPSPTRIPYEVIPVKFVVGGLPEDVDEWALRDDMMLALRRVLTDIAARVSDLKITGVVESDPFNAAENGRVKLTGGADGDGPRNGKRKERFYYDVTVLRHPNKNRKFAPLIMAELRNSYEEMLDDIQSYTAMSNFGAGLDFVWCVTDDEGTFGVCTAKEQVVPLAEPVTISLPRKIDISMEDFIIQIKAIFKKYLQDVKKLNIIDVEARQIDRGKWTKDIFLTIRNEGNDAVKAESTIHSALKRAAKDIEDDIEAYLSMATGDGTTWYRDAKGSYTIYIQPKQEKSEEVHIIVREEDPPLFQEEEPDSLYPLWAIIFVSIILALSLCFCMFLLVHCAKKRSRYRKEKSFADRMTGATWSTSLASVPDHWSSGYNGDRKAALGPPPQEVHETYADCIAPRRSRRRDIQDTSGRFDVHREKRPHGHSQGERHRRRRSRRDEQQRQTSRQRVRKGAHSLEVAQGKKRRPSKKERMPASSSSLRIDQSKARKNQSRDSSLLYIMPAPEEAGSLEQDASPIFAIEEGTHTLGPDPEGEAAQSHLEVPRPSRPCVVVRRGLPTNSTRSTHQRVQSTPCLALTGQEQPPAPSLAIQQMDEKRRPGPARRRSLDRISSTLTTRKELPPPQIAKENRHEKRRPRRARRISLDRVRSAVNGHEKRRPHPDKHRKFDKMSSAINNFEPFPDSMTIEQGDEQRPQRSAKQRSLDRIRSKFNSCKQLPNSHVAVEQGDKKRRQRLAKGQSRNRIGSAFNNCEQPPTLSSHENIRPRLVKDHSRTTNSRRNSHKESNFSVTSNPNSRTTLSQNFLPRLDMEQGCIAPLSLTTTHDKDHYNLPLQRHCSGDIDASDSEDSSSSSE